ncbi:orotidine-5'-phosphate decarboxylase [Arboricoccus pini]|uniref:Orotidine 5'-phosphate decarboxylase n=1 Tax=Arboricoccus pini TaxID=1963835 RepID=A0A212R7B3_9PROT|nr:orotidine-5'-phosphate decarboxylase [Arboricoccus pini]SNB67913.1 orotidine-5'-phosphate decarboxylase [Arboricoccus pini]
MGLTSTAINPIYVAIDRPDLKGALELAGVLKGHVGGLKLGLEFVTANGPAGVREMAAVGLPVFLDLKFHDIPNTVHAAVKAACELGVAIINVHAAGGPAMLAAARDAAAASRTPPKVIAVTVLTSLNGDDLAATGVAASPDEHAVRLALLAKSNGLDGVVCSAHELKAIRTRCGPDFMTIVPGIRPANAADSDQKRIMTPEAAMAAGADLLVIGRPITAAADPVEAARAIGVTLKANCS